MIILQKQKHVIYLLDVLIVLEPPITPVPPHNPTRGIFKAMIF
jgi:hypothetical protein